MSSSSAKGKKVENDGFPGNRKKQSVIFVAPLNSAPYLGPSSCYTSSMSNENAEKASPAVIFLPPESSHQEIHDLAAQTKTGVVLTGSAALGKIGPAIGLLDVAEADDSYFFRVSLPGVSKDAKEFTCDIEEDGMIMIKGATMTGEKTVCRDSQVFTMLTQNLCPPGHFTISFRLPGSVSKNDFICNFGSDGVLEGIVKKVDETSECEL